MTILPSTHRTARRCVVAVFVAFLCCALSACKSDEKPAKKPYGPELCDEALADTDGTLDAIDDDLIRRTMEAEGWEVGEEFTESGMSAEDMAELARELGRSGGNQVGFQLRSLHGVSPDETRSASVSLMTLDDAKDDSAVCQWSRGLDEAGFGKGRRAVTAQVRDAETWESDKEASVELLNAVLAEALEE